jgi:hypothetical protein
VRVLDHRRAPGVEYGRDTDAGAEMFRIGCDRENGLARCLEQQIVNHRFVLISDVSDRHRQREDDVEVRHRQELGLALGEPLLCRCGLAFVAMPITARVIGDPRITAVLVLTTRNMAAERCCAAALDRTHDLELAEAHMAGVGLTPRRSEVAEDIGDFESGTDHDGRFIAADQTFFWLAV